MNKTLLIAVLAACGGPKRVSSIDNSGGTGGGTKPGCPLAAAPEVEDRFPVGAVPDYRVNSAIGEAAKCHDVFVPNDVVVAEGTSVRIVKEGVFEGHCPGEPDSKRKYQAYSTASVAVEVNALAMNDGELGLNKPITLDSKAPDKMAGVIAHPADSCGSQLTVGLKASAEWSAGPGCDKVAKVVPYDVDSPPDSKSTQQQIAAIGPGTCTITATLFGAKGDVVVTVN